ncbi:type IV secretory system conjugative DNA transfer family protein [Maricaulis sp.]|uniref:type IV secretory system conjugative DNA transfer family protein n=1 Tax=Maricaulis sp. TaxID=1486257 RepID=UPI0026023A8F|nr:type IV secretory system conjugative DNA transfer family protein [Maricaulis sp.]
MSFNFDPEQHRFGSARFASEEEIARAGLFDLSPGALYVGHIGGRSLMPNLSGGYLTVAAPRSGKLATVLAYSSCLDGFSDTAIYLDPKGEIGSISFTLKPSYYWNPARIPGLPYHRINPVGHLHIDNPNLHAAAKAFADNFVEKTGAAGSVYFEGRGEQFLEAVVLTLARLDGVVTLKRLFEVLMLIPGGGDGWLEFAFEMSESGFTISKTVEEEIAAARGNDSGGFRGIVGELLRAVAPLSDPVLLESVSPPFDMCLSQLCGPEAINLFLMPPGSWIAKLGGVLKSFFVGVKHYKESAPSAPRQTWFLDEIGLLGNFPLAMELFTIGAGMGCRPWAFYQSTEQMKATAPGGDVIIPASAAVRQYFAVRDDVSAARLSKQLGMQTLEYDDKAAQLRAQYAREEAARHLIAGGDPVQAALALSHHSALEANRSQQQRELRTMDEVIFTLNDRQYLFIDGVPHPVYAERGPYWESYAMRGRFLPNPYHPPTDSVRIKTRLGHANRRVITERVPAQFAHLPQFADGYWSYIEGFRP